MKKNRKQLHTNRNIRVIWTHVICAKNNQVKIFYSYSHKVALWCASFHLKESFKAAFFLVGLQLKDPLFSTEGTVEARQGKQFCGRIPQLSKKLPSWPAFSPEDEEISSAYTGLISFRGPSDFTLAVSLTELRAEWPVNDSPSKPLWESTSAVTNT